MFECHRKPGGNSSVKFSCFDFGNGALIGFAPRRKNAAAPARWNFNPGRSQAWQVPALAARHGFL
jgi:hypothetical protein